jgi:long-chain-fatty-acid--CoA ligase ACSBG
VENQKPGECCFLIYTSGTTGKPKAVMLSHDNLTWTWLAYNSIKYPDDAIEEVPELNIPSRAVSFLPLSHITALMADFSRPIVLRRLIELTFVPAKVLQNNNLHETLQLIKPTELMAVPRVYEKFESRIRMMVSSKWRPIS